MTRDFNEPAVLDLSDHRVAYVRRDPEHPAGAPMVLLHGGGLDRRMWGPQLARDRDRDRDRTVIVPDARGHGGTSDADAPYRHCDDVVALLDALDIERAVLVGLSMGGGTAVDTALEHPDRVAGLVVAGTGTSEPEFREPWTRDILATWERTQAAGDAEGWIEAFMRFVPGPRREPTDVDPAVTELVETMVRDTLAGHLRLDADGKPTPPVPPTPVRDTWARLPGITVPVLAVCGTADGDDHLRMTRALAETVPDGRLTLIEGSAHYPNLERPEEFDAAVAGFLRGLG